MEGGRSVFGKMWAREVFWWARKKLDFFDREWRLVAMQRRHRLFHFLLCCKGGKGVEGSARSPSRPSYSVP